ncbi:glycoside hydrolase family 36 protein [Leptospira ilyithenensis]|uniref:Alpha-galactosidase n=1 Tax=Leptospira ilyithenensis TaxID=2484901 RepID=A0A4R9LJI5_9LEPT|nr:glycoside hydrolase family 36 protein [Leptospira ilyithenensis]TGN07047.1 alpha-galactosidase [Leptospira ilyithenensis]
MKIQYRVYDSITLSSFLPAKPGLFISECKKFELQIVSTSISKAENILSPKLIWRESTRPEVGFSIDFLELDLDARPDGNGFQLFQHGYQSWSLSKKMNSDEEDRSPRLAFLQYSQENIYSKHAGKPGEYISEYFALLYSNYNKQGLLFASLDRGEFGIKFNVRLTDSGEMEKVSAIYDFYCLPDLRPNAKLAISKIKIESFTKDPEKKLAGYFRELGEKLGTPVFPKKVPTGWCSWYYYYTKISQKNILENLAKVREQNLPIEFFQIDDGYQKEIGDWLVPNDKFPGGMRILADEIKRAGLKPGIWLAPFLVRKKSEFFRKYPEAILKDENGKPVPALYQPLWGLDATYALDITHPTSLSYLEKVFSTVVKEWGYSYLKLDFLYAGLLPGEVYKKNLSPQGRYMEALQLIRKTVGKNTFLLGCGAPMLPSVGFFDGMRISCDVTPSWNQEKIRIFLKDRNALSTKTALTNDLTRASMHRNLWLNDPDCLLVRKKKNKMSESQTILMASIMAISGGMLLVSDDLTKLEPDRLQLLKKAFQLNADCQAHTPIPIGIFEEDFPHAMYNPAGFLGIWNPNEIAKKITVRLPFTIKSKEPYLDYWTGTIVDLELSAKKDSIEMELPAYGSVVLSI